MHQLFLPVLKELCVNRRLCTAVGVESSCIYRITAQKASVQEREGAELHESARWAIAARSLTVAHAVFPWGPWRGKSQKNYCLFPMRRDASGGYLVMSSCPKTQMFWRANQKQVLSSFPSLMFSSLYDPPGKHWQTNSSLQPRGRRQIRTAKDCYPSRSFIPSFSDFWDLHSYRSISQAHRGMCHGAVSGLYGTLWEAFTVICPRKPEGLFQYHKNWAKANSQILGRKQPRITNSRYHLPLGAITVANDSAFCWQDESLREAKQKEKYFTILGWL